MTYAVSGSRSRPPSPSPPLAARSSRISHSPDRISPDTPPETLGSCRAPHSSPLHALLLLLGAGTAAPTGRRPQTCPFVLLLPASRRAGWKQAVAARCRCRPRRRRRRGGSARGWKGGRAIRGRGGGRSRAGRRAGQTLGCRDGACSRRRR